ncbi:HD domain-containing protein [Novosphingobium sp.]|uniref:HD domain-containing protein n=1 Tax=Novosphingobium sp. TaxID=1874826 RepID=UPI003340ADC7
MTTDLALILNAAAFAADRHRDLRRKDADASPYINHPLALAAILAGEGGVTDATVIAAALLHDTVEDTATTREELVARFGPAVAGIVAEVTDNKKLPKPERKQLQIVHAGTASDGAKLVKLADKIANLRDISASPPADWDTARKADYFDWAAKVIDRVRGVHPRLEALFDAEYAKRP